ncbi:MAG TPA: ROK family protein [Steroidobacteraceae bacterium]|nr:ROK family protein [Steroidobacteraceae bacterium]
MRQPMNSGSSSSSPQLYGAIEAGGTKFICAAGYDALSPLEGLRESIPTSTPGETLAAVAGFFERVRREVGPLAGIGVAAFGPIDIDRASSSWGCLLETPKAGWSRASLIAPLERFGCPIAVDTDVNAAALAEARFGAGADVDSLAYVTVGTGIGGGVVIDGRTLKGIPHPEMGHIRVRRDESDVSFGGVCPFHGDCLEGLASGPAVRARWHAAVETWPDDHVGFEIVGGYLGQLAATIALMISCRRIVFGGGVMADGRMLRHIRRATRASLNGYLPIEARAGGFDRFITAPALGPRAGVTGAMILAREAPPQTGSSRL